MAAQYVNGEEWAVSGGEPPPLCLWVVVWPLGGGAALASAAMKLFNQFTFMKTTTS